MSDHSPLEQHTYRLSAIDQSAPRQYISIALIYPCDAEHVTRATEGFRAAIKILLSRLPMLAGNLRQATLPRGYLEVAVSIDLISKFGPTVVYFDGVGSTFASYEQLRSKNFALDALEIMQLAPFIEKPDPSAGPAFAARLNIISGGIVAVLQLHHTVADAVGVRTIVEILSRVQQGSPLEHDALSDHAVGTSRCRNLLSNARGVTAPPTGVVAAPEMAQERTETCVFDFDLRTLEAVTEMVNERSRRFTEDQQGWVDPRGQLTRQLVQPLHVLHAVVWHATTRARKQAGLVGIEQPSRLAMPVGLRQRFSPLEYQYFGNAEVTAEAVQSTTLLDACPEPGALAETAQQVFRARNAVNDHFVLAAIARAAQRDYTSDPPTSTATASDLIIEDWHDVQISDGSAGLGLGQPTCTRRLSDNSTDEGCTIYARPEQGDVWEVSATLDERVIHNMTLDEAFMKFVKYANGESYVDGITQDQHREQLMQQQRQEERRHRARNHAGRRNIMFLPDAQAHQGLPQ